MINRVKELRKLKKLTQKEFGERIGVSGDNISSIEKGKVKLTDRNISLICEKFNVNEEWLREGKGEIFCQDEKSIVKELVEKYNFDDMVKSCIEVLVTLEPEEIKPLLAYAKKVALKYASEHIDEVHEIQQEQYVHNTHEVQEVQKTHIEQELEAYRLELEAEEKGRILSVSDAINEKKA